MPYQAAGPGWRARWSMVMSVHGRSPAAGGGTRSSPRTGGAGVLARCPRARGRWPEVPELAPAPLVLADPRRVGLLAAELIVNRLIARPGARLLLGVGPGTRVLFAALRERAQAGALPSGSATVLALDEYV